MTALRVLPIRLPLLPGEGLDSWLEALARRNGLSLSTFLHLTGIPQPFFTRTLVTATDAAALRALETVTGTTTGRLDQAVFPSGFPFGPRRQQRCRFCPQCLAERGGRTRLEWWLPWSFACTTHQALLHDLCPDCRAPFRLNLPRLTHRRPPATCSAKPNNGRTVCASVLSDATALGLPPGHPLLATQEWITALLTQSAPEKAIAVFNDLNNSTRWLMQSVDDTDLQGMGPAVRESWRNRQDTVGVRADRITPLSAAVRGILAHAARPVLDHTDETAAIEAARVLRQRRDTKHKIIPVGIDHIQWRQLSPRLRRRFLRAADPALAALDRLRLRTCTPHAELPDPGSNAVTDRIGKIPQLLWPGWTVRLMPRQGAEEVLFRGIAAALLLVPGEPVLSARGITDRLHAHLPNAMTVTLQRVLRASHPDVLTALCNLADYLDQHGSPIDYARRRAVIPAQPITHHAWQQLCFRTDTQPGEQTTTHNYAPRFVHAQRYLHQLLTGSDLTDPKHPLAWRSSSDRSRYLAFPPSLTTGQRDALHHHARALLERLHIDEPLTWEPPAACAHGLHLPGPEITDIDREAVRRLVVDEGRRPTDAARHLRTTLTHVRFALEIIEPTPAESRGPSPLAAWRLRQRASSILTREFLDREYVQAGRNLTQIARSVGLPRNVVVEQAKALGVTIYRTRRPVAMDPRWLRKQYLISKRTTQDIAREIGAEDETVRRRLQHLGIALRPAGVHSSTAMIAKLDGGLPHDIRKAVEGSLQGWHRLHRFQIAMAFPNLQSAADYVGAHQSALVTQFQRLEADIGEALFHRSAFGRTQRPTPQGQALLRHLSTKPVQDRMRTALSDTELAPMPDTATLTDAATSLTTRRPSGPLRPYDGIAVPRIRVRAETLVLLRDLLSNPDQEFYGAQISARTGIGDGSVSTRLRQLEQAGWLTASFEDDDSWRRRATPGRGPGRRRTYYTLTPEGRRAASYEVERGTSRTRKEHSSHDG